MHRRARRERRGRDLSGVGLHGHIWDSVENLHCLFEVFRFVLFCTVCIQCDGTESPGSVHMCAGLRSRCTPAKRKRDRPSGSVPVTTLAYTFCPFNKWPA